MACRRREIRATCRSNEGVSFLIALVFVLICFAVAAIVISSAGVNAERAKQHKVEEQAYFASQSALQLVDGASRRDGSLLGSPKLTLTGSLDNLQPAGTIPTNDLGLANWAQAQAKLVGQGREPVKRTVTVPGFKHENADVPAVELTYTMKGSGSYDIQVAARVQPLSGEVSADYANTLYREFVAEVGASGIQWNEVDG